MVFRRAALAAACAASMVSAPVLAQASEARSLSVASHLRSGAAQSDANGLRGASPALAVGIGFFIVLIVLVINARATRSP